MLGIRKNKEKDVSGLLSDITSVEFKIEALKSAIEFGERLLDKYSKPQIESFMKEWATGEMSRLAHLRMSAPLDDRDVNLTLKVQYEAAKKFGEEKEAIQQGVDDNRIILANAQEKLAELKKQLNNKE